MAPIPLTFRLVWVAPFLDNRISIKDPLLPFINSYAKVLLKLAVIVLDMVPIDRWSV